MRASADEVAPPHAGQAALPEWLAGADGITTFAGRLDDGVCCKDAECRFVYLNDAALRAFDLLGAAPALGFRLTELCATAEARVIEEHDRAALASGITSVSTERVVAAGYARSYIVTRLPLRDSAGHVRGLTCLWVERHAVDGALEIASPPPPAAATCSGEFSQRLRDRYVGVIAHDLRSPLNGIQSWTNVLEMQSKGDASPLATRALAGIKSGIDAQMRLIDRLLDTTRILNGTVALSIAPTPIGVALDAALNEVASLASARDVHIVKRFASSYEAKVLADPTRLGQLVRLLLSASVQCAPAASEVVLEVHPAHDALHVSVRDRGPLASNPDAVAFEATRIDGARDPDTLGMDLSLVRRLAELQGGSAEAGQAPDGTAAMTVRLPLVPA